MKLHTWVAWVAGVTVLVLSTASAAQAQRVTFSGINDAVPTRFFDAATTVRDPLNANKLLIGLHKNFNPQTFTYNLFKVSTAAFYPKDAMDTISFLITAPAGYYISKLTYTQRGTGSITRTGKASGGATWVVDDVARNLGLFGANPTMTRTVDLTGQKKTLIPVSITNNLHVFSTPQLGAATLAISSADVLVTLLPLPR